jgi:ABC-type amino acid transport system permease subunit
VARALDWIVPRENPRGVIYGIIVIGAVLAAEGGLRETYAETAGSALIASSTYWLADAYASVLGERLETHAPLTLSGLWRELVRNWSIVRGAAIPLLVLLVGWTVGAPQATAHEIALWSVVANLVAFELIAGIRARATPIQLVLEVGVGVTLALGVLALKLVLHT